MKWTAEEEQQLREMYDADTPASVIAKIMGRTVSAVYRRANLLSLTDLQRQQKSAKVPRNIERAYGAGRKHRQSGGAKNVPANLPPVGRAWWLAGWHDADMEAA